MKTFLELLEEAKQLPTHTEGKLNEHYVFFKERKNMFIVITDDSTASIYNEMNRLNLIEIAGRNGVQGYYTRTQMTYRDNGSIRPKSEWETKIFYHKRWSRKDIKITNVTYDVIGLKRQTTQLPAGVLISDVKFE